MLYTRYDNIEKMRTTTVLNLILTLTLTTQQDAHDAFPVRDGRLAQRALALDAKQARPAVAAAHVAAPRRARLVGLTPTHATHEGCSCPCSCSCSCSRSRFNARFNSNTNTNSDYGLVGMLWIRSTPGIGSGISPCISPCISVIGVIGSSLGLASVLRLFSASVLASFFF